MNQLNSLLKAFKKKLTSGKQTDATCSKAGDAAVNDADLSDDRMVRKILNHSLNSEVGKV